MGAMAVAGARPPMTRLYVLCNRVVMGALALLEALHCGLWLGLLRRAQLNAVTADFYRNQGCYVDSAYNASGLADWERAAIERHFPTSGQVLVPGCGGGRELAALAARGFAVVGFDPDERFVQAAQDMQWTGAAHAPVVMLCAPDAVPPGLGSHDACVLGWGAYTHIAGRDARVGFLRHIGNALRPGAPLLLSFWANPPSPRKLRIAHRVASLVAKVSLNPRVPEYGDWLGQHFAHYFDEDAIRAELADADFELLEYIEEPYAHAVARYVA